jgi:uncharacterized membrane protein
MMAGARAIALRRRWVRFEFRDHIWMTSALLGLAGAGVGAALGEATSLPLPGGVSWTGTVSSSRGALATIFGIEETVLSVALTMNVLVLQVTASQYSPRLQALYARGVSLRRAMPMVALSSAYLCAAAVALGASGVREEAPRPVLPGALLLLVLSFGTLVYDLLSTLTQLRIEVVLHSLRCKGLAAHKRLLAKRARAGFVPAGSFPVAGDTAPLRAAERGYLVDVDLQGLTAQARAQRVRVRLDSTLGDFIDEGEIVGWLFAEEGASVPTDVSELVDSLTVARARSAVYDVGLLLRLLTDIADRALSPAVNDPYTARQALNECRVVLCRLARTEHGGYAVQEPDGSPRVFVSFASLIDHLSMVVDGPTRFGASDSDTLEALLDIALEVGLSSDDEQGRNAARAVAHRVLAAAEHQEKLGSARLRILRARVDSVLGALEQGAPHTERVARPTWGTDWRKADSLDPGDCGRDGPRR